MGDRDELLRDYLAAWNDHDADRVASFFAPDAVYEDHGAGETLRGVDAIRGHAGNVSAAFPDLRFEVVRAAHGEDFTTGEWRSEMTHLGEFSGLAPTGRVVTSSGVDVATLAEDGRITHLASYYDGAAIMRALGLLPGRDSRTERGLLLVHAALSRLRRRA